MELFEKYKIIIYLIIGVLYFLLKGRKSNNEKQQKTPTQKEVEGKTPTTLAQKRRDYKSPVPKPPAKDPFSLDDILREFQDSSGNKKVNKTVEYQKSENEEGVGQVSKVNYERIGKEEENLSSSVMNEKDKEKKDNFKPYSKDTNQVNEYAELIKNPESLKKVIVAQEILRPKYF